MMLDITTFGCMLCAVSVPRHLPTIFALSKLHNFNPTFAFRVRMKAGRFIFPLLLLGAAAVLNSQTPSSPVAESEEAQQTTVVSQAQVSRLITEIGAQQAELAKNQKAMNERLDKLAETLRQARIWSARRGGGGGSVNPTN